MVLHLTGILAGAGLVVALGCGKQDSGYFTSRMLSHRVAETNTEAVLNRISSSDEWTIEMYYGETSSGLNFISIRSNGTVEYYAGRGYKLKQNEEAKLTWRHGTFAISGDLIHRLWQLVKDERVMFLDAEYNANVHDGGRLCFKFLSGKDCKYIDCDNHFPEETIALFDFIMVNVVMSNDAQIMNGTIVNHAMVPTFQPCGVQAGTP